jgi:hypothetical protein
MNLRIFSLVSSLIICLIFVSIDNTNCCKKNTIKNIVIPHCNELKLDSIAKLLTDSCTIGFYGGGVFHLCFNRDMVEFYFNPQCMYSYKTRLIGNQLFFYWSYDMDCTFDRGLRNTFGLKVTPQKGLPFAYFTLKNDTTLHVTYLYKEWVKRINETTSNGDTLFPQLFYIKQRL